MFLELEQKPVFTKKVLVFVLFFLNLESLCVIFSHESNSLTCHFYMLGLKTNNFEVKVNAAFEIDISQLHCQGQTFQMNAKFNHDVYKLEIRSSVDCKTSNFVILKIPFLKLDIDSCGQMIQIIVHI